MSNLQVVEDFQQKDDCFSIIINHRRKNYLKKRCVFYEKRRKEKKILLKGMCKFIEQCEKNKKELDYINGFLSFNEEEKSANLELMISRESTLEIGLKEREQQRSIHQIFEELKQMPKKQIYENKFEVFSYNEEFKFFQIKESSGLSFY